MTLDFSKNFGDMINNTSAMQKAVKVFRSAVEDILNSKDWGRFVEQKSLHAREADKLRFLMEKLESTKVDVMT